MSEEEAEYEREVAEDRREIQRDTYRTRLEAKRLKAQRDLEELRKKIGKTREKPMSEEEAEVEREEAEDLREITRDAHRARLEAKRLKAQRDLEELKRPAGAEGGSKPSLATTLLAGLIKQGASPEKATEAINSLDDKTIAKLMALESAPSNPLLPLILLGQQQGSSTDDLIKLAESIAGKTSGKESFTEFYDKVVKPITEQNKELLGALREEKYNQLAKEIQEIKYRPTAFSELKEKSEEFTAMRKIFGGGPLGGGQMDPNTVIATKKIDLEIAREETRREEMKDERDRQFKLEEKKIAADERRTDAFIGFGERIVQGVVKEFTVEEGGGGGEAQPMQGEVVQPKVEGDFEVKNCPACGAPIPVNLKERPPSVRCSACDATVKVKY